MEKHSFHKYFLALYFFFGGGGGGGGGVGGQITASFTCDHEAALYMKPLLALPMSTKITDVCFISLNEQNFLTVTLSDSGDLF